MTVVIWIAAVVVVAAVVFAARGRGGELSAERGDYVPLDMGPVSATDVALLRPPTGLWGYNMQATDEALEQIAESIRERDVRIVALEQLVTDLSREHPPKMPLGSPYAAARHRRAPAWTAGTDPDWATPVESGGADPLWTTPGEASGAEPARRVTFEPGGTDPLVAAGGADPLRATPAEGGETEPLRAAGAGSAGTGPLPAATYETVSTESVRLPADPGRPGGTASGPPPEQSHD